jgi:hypothetical protein
MQNVFVNLREGEERGSPPMWIFLFLFYNGGDHVYCNKAQNKLAIIENYPE